MCVCETYGNFFIKCNRIDKKRIGRRTKKGRIRGANIVIKED